MPSLSALTGSDCVNPTSINFLAKFMTKGLDARQVKTQVFCGYERGDIEKL